jgi:hypothetical protein
MSREQSEGAVLVSGIGGVRVREEREDERAGV